MTLAMKYSKPVPRAKAPEADDLVEIRLDERPRIRATVSAGSVAAGCGIAALVTVAVIVGLAAYSCSRMPPNAWWQRAQTPPPIPVHSYPGGITLTNTYTNAMRGVKVSLHTSERASPGETQDFSCSVIPEVKVGETYWIMPSRFIAMSGERWNSATEKPTWIDVSYTEGNIPVSFSADL
jgi:hypothetical protein